MLIENFVGKMYGCSTECGACKNPHYEPGGLKFMAQTLKPGMNMLDIGAHVGLYACYASKLLKGNGIIHAFEAEPETYDVLKMNKDILYPDIEIHNMAVWNENGELGINLSRPAQHWMEPGGTGIIAVALDSYFGNEIIFDFIKIDVEGAEYRALLGMRGMLRHHRPGGIIIEIASHHLKKYGDNPKDVVEFMEYINMKPMSGKADINEKLINLPSGEIVKINYIPK